MKKLSIGITSIISASCLLGAVLSLNPATAAADSANITMVDGASVRLSSYKSGIGFTSRVNYDYYNQLDETYDVVTGTLILPTDYLTDNAITTVTHATLEAVGEAGVFFQDVVNQGWKNTATAEKDGYYEYRGSLVNLNVANYSREFSAVGYVGYKTAEEEGYTYEYTAYDVANNSRAIDDVAFNAFVDRTQTEQTVDGVEYEYAVEKDGTYSCYTNDERNILSGYMYDYATTASKLTIMQEEDGVLSLNALQAVAIENGFTANSIVGATRNNKNVTLGDDGLDVSLNGVYNVTLKGETAYANGAVVPATLTATVDVWSEATKNVMISVDDIYVVGGYTGQAQSFGDYGRGTYTVGDRTGRYYRSAKLGAAVAFGKPLHSKEYYEQWLEANPYAQSYISIDWYFDNPDCDPNGDVRTFDRFSGFKQYVADKEGKLNTWFNGTKELTAFLSEDFEGISAYYDTTMLEIETQKVPRFSDGNGVVDINGNLVYDYLLATKIESKLDNLYLSAMTIELGEMKTIETTQLVDRNSETSIDPSLTEEEQKVVSYWQGQGYTVSYEFVKRYSDGTPISKANSVDSLATFAIDSTVEDGIYYLNVIATKGEKTGVCLSKAYDIYGSTDRVEYENFKHTDSQYAVACYGIERDKKMTVGGTVTIPFVSPFELQSSKYQIFTCSFDKEGTDPYTLYMLSLGKVTLTGTSASKTGTTDANFRNRELGYLSLNWDSEDTQSKLDVLYNYQSSWQEYIFTYILPRHTKAYYEHFASSCGDFSILYKSTNADETDKMRYYYPMSISDEGLVMGKGNKHSSSYNQNISDAVQITISDLIKYYDAYAEGKVPMLITMGCAFSSMVDTTADNEDTRLYEIGFESAN